MAPSSDQLQHSDRFYDQMPTAVTGLQVTSTGMTGSAAGLHVFKHHG